MLIFRGAAQSTVKVNEATYPQYVNGMMQLIADLEYPKEWNPYVVQQLAHIVEDAR